MYLSVIVPTYKRNDLLTKCLDSLSPAKQKITADAYEVIVTDDSPDFLSLQLSELFPWAKFIQGPRRGPAANRNNGAANSKGEWLIFIDDDCIPEEGILTAYAGVIAEGKFKAFEGMIDADRPRERFDEESPLNLEGGCFWSCNIAVEKNLFTSLHGFDEGFPFPAMEDMDFYSRLQKLAESAFVPQAKVIHPWRRLKPFQNFRKRLVSNTYMLKKYKVKKGFKYRIQRIKLFVGLLISDFKRLRKCSYRGTGVFIDHICFETVMLFV